MATSTLLQKLDPASAGFGATTSNRESFETFAAVASISAGGLVALDLSQTDDGDKLLCVTSADSGTAAKSIVIGVATATVAGTATEPVPLRVKLRGIATVAIDGSGTAVAAGDALCLSGVKLVKAVAGEGIVAQSLGAVTTDTTGKVYILPRF